MKGDVNQDGSISADEFDTWESSMKEACGPKYISHTKVTEIGYYELKIHLFMISIYAVHQINEKFKKVFLQYYWQLQDDGLFHEGDMNHDNFLDKDEFYDEINLQYPEFQ